jgi:hypothetical protein
MHDRAERLALVLEAIAATDSKIASHRTAPFTPRCPPLWPRAGFRPAAIPR